MYNVFNTAELLELILANMSALEQLRARAICKNFQETIDSSPEIRIGMFLQADTSVLVVPTAQPYTIRGIKCDVVEAREEKSIVVSIDSYLADVCYAARALWTYPFLRNVLVAQPPPKQAVLYMDCYCTRGSQGATFQASETGLTFGHMFDAIDSSIATCTQCSDVLFWRIQARLC